MVVNLSEEGMTEYTPKLKDACTNLLKNYPDYLELWENEAPLYAALAICTLLVEEQCKIFRESRFVTRPIRNVCEGLHRVW